MKLLIFVLVISSFKGICQKAKIEYKGAANSRLYLSIPLKSGEFFNGSFITTRTSSNGYAAFEIDIESPAFVKISSPRIKGLVYIVPGGKIKVTEWNNNFSFSGSFRKENQALTKVFFAGNNPHAIGIEPKFVKTLVQYDDPTQIAYAVEKKIDSIFVVVNQFNISDSFKALLTRLAMYQVYDKATAALVLKFREQMYYQYDNNVEAGWKKIYDSFFKEKLLYSRDYSLSAYYDYLFNYLVRYKAFFLKERTADLEGKNIDRVDYYNSVYFETAVPTLIEETLRDHIKPWFSANYISQFIMGSMEFHTPQLGQYYEKVKKDYDIERYDQFLMNRLNDVLKN